MPLGNANPSRTPQHPKEPCLLPEIKLRRQFIMDPILGVNLLVWMCIYFTNKRRSRTYDMSQ